MVDSLGMNRKGKAMKPLGVEEGVRTRSLSFGEEPGESTRRHEVRCPEGHVMRAHVTTEMLMQCRPTSFCDGCESEIEKSGASYECIKCHRGADCQLTLCSDHYTLCVDCAREALGFQRCEDRGVPTVEIVPGDIFLCGPNRAGIHHVVLACGELREAEPEYRNLLDIAPGMELYACETIESTQSYIGEDTWWYPATTLYQRNPYTGEVFLVGDHPPESNEVSAAMDPVPMKVLLHPLRGEDGQEELDREAFEEVIEEASKEARRYGKMTAVKSFLKSFTAKGTIDPRDYPTEEKREALLEKIHKSWTARPICASVAIKCWQKYFENVCETSEETVQRIFEVMPHWCDKSTPSLMVKVLTQHGWVLLDNFDG